MTSPTHSDVAIPPAQEHLRALVSYLDERYLAEAIDVRIYRATERFRQVRRRTYTPERAVRVTAYFLRHVCRFAAPNPRRLPLAQARVEAVALIAQGYDNGECRGCDAAFDDVHRFGVRGVVAVIERVAELLRLRQRQAYLMLLAHRHIDALDWPTRRELAALVQAQFGSRLPRELQECQPEQLIGVLFELVYRLVVTGARCRQSGASDSASALHDSRVFAQQLGKVQQQGSP